MRAAVVVAIDRSQQSAKERRRCRNQRDRIGDHCSLIDSQRIITTVRQ